MIFFIDFERNWNSGSGNSYNSFSGGNSNKNGSPFDRDFGGFNNFSNNSNNSPNGNFANDRFSNNGNGNGNGSINNSGGQYAVHLRGMPYDCGDTDIMEFFAPLKVVNCQVLYNNNGRNYRNVWFL